MMRAARVALLVVGIALTGAPAAHAQEGPRREGFWFGFGLGGGGGDERAEVAAASAQMVLQTGPHYFALRLLGMADPIGGSSGSFTEVSALYGRALLGGLGHVSIASGLAYVNVHSCHPDGSRCEVVGVPIVAEAMFRPYPAIGLGVQGFANLNREARYGGVMALLHLGWVR